jgi:NAD(P)-dependent dehydrogenase (short-subunit alcohol dehydrogenase family)
VNRNPQSGPSLRLKGKTVLVTGAGSEFGRAIALSCAAEGAGVALVDGVASPTECAEEVRTQGGSAHVISKGSESDGPDGLIQSAFQWRNSLDVLVNASVSIARTPEEHLTSEQWEQSFESGVHDAFFLSRAAARTMKGSGGGTIVHLGSIAGVVTTGAPLTYSLQKAAIIHMTRVLANRWGPLVRINAVGTGYIETALNESWLADSGNRSWVLDRTPLGRIGTTEDVASAVVFLASDHASFITGQHLLVDGGWTTA